MRILHVITSLEKGGAETMLFNLCAHRRRLDFEHGVLSLTGEGCYGPLIRKLGIPVFAVKLQSPAAVPSSILQAFAVARRFRPDILQGWMYHGNLAASFLRTLCVRNASVFWNIRHSLHFFREEARGTRHAVQANRLFSRGAAVCIYNSRTSSVMHERYGFSSRATEIIPNGFDTERFRPDPVVRDAVRCRLRLAPDEPVVGLVGRYHPLKDYAGYLKAVSFLRTTDPSLRFTTVMAGRGLTDGNACLRAEIEASPPGGPLILLGESDDVPSLMNAFDVLCLPSQSEAFPNVVGEAMACGLPCVVTDVGDAAELTGDTGIVVPPKNPEALAAGLKSLLTMKAAERTSRGAAARRRIISHYSIAAVVAQYERLYERMKGAPD